MTKQTLAILAIMTHLLLMIYLLLVSNKRSIKRPINQFRPSAERAELKGLESFFCSKSCVCCDESVGWFKCNMKTSLK